MFSSDHGKMGKIWTLERIYHKAQRILFEGQAFILTLCLSTFVGFPALICLSSDNDSLWQMTLKLGLSESQMREQMLGVLSIKCIVLRSGSSARDLREHGEGPLVRDAAYCQGEGAPTCSPDSSNQG